MDVDISPLVFRTVQLSWQRVLRYRSGVAERPVQDGSIGCDCRAVESDEFRRSDGKKWLNVN